MITFLARRLIPNYQETGCTEVRSAYGVLSGCVGIVLNVLLCLGKLFAGTVSGSIAVTADALNNLSDAGSSIITLIGFKLSEKKPDPDHPFGHGRMEYVSGLIVSMAVLLMGFELLKTSIGKIAAPEPVSMNLLSAGILLVSVLCKLYMFAYNRALSKRLDSAALEATAMDSRSDAVATTAVFIAMTIAHFTHVNIDGWAGLLVALFILWSGVNAAKDTIDPLLGASPDPELVERIRKEVMAADNVRGIHDMVVHDYGPGRRMVSLHAEVPADGDILALHDGIDRLEHQLRDTLGCEAVIHMDPIVTDDERLAPTRQRVTDLIQQQIDEHIGLHDFRMVSGPTHTNVIFDAVAPYNFRMSDKELAAAIARLVREMEPTYYAVVNIDHSRI